MSAGPAAETKQYGRTAGMVSAGIGFAGLLLYGFFALGSHTLSGDDYGEVVVLWLIVFGLVVTLFRPVEQLLAREIAAARAGGGSAAHAMRSAALIVAAMLVVFMVTAMALRETIVDEVFSGREVLFWGMVGGFVSFSLEFYARGYLAGMGRFDLYAGLLVAESLVLVGAAGLAAAGVFDGVAPFAIGIALAPLLGLAGVAGFLIAGGFEAGEALAPAEAASTLAAHGGFAAAVLLVMLSGQVLINAGPLFVRGSEGADLAGFTFNLMMVVRAPQAIFQGVIASLLPHLAAAQARPDGAATFRDSLRGTLVGIGVFTAATAVGVLILGPPVMQLAFGDNFDYGRGELVVVAIGAGLFLAALTLTQAALVRGRAPAAAAAWTAAAVVFCACNLSGLFDAVWGVVGGFAIASALAAACLVAIARSVRHGHELAPGSLDELQARLPLAEE